MSAHGDPNSPRNDDIRVETTDVSTRPVALSVLALAVFTLLFTFAAHLTFQFLGAHMKASSPPASPLAEQYAAKEPPEPRLQIDPKKDLVVHRAAEDKILRSLAWVDREAGIVQVPIERAMELLLAKGLPARDGEVPWQMAPIGVAPSQPSEGSGAPDWIDAAGAKPAHGGGHAPAAHAPAAEAHGH
ncbi:MAG: hypothetical protein ABR538_04035 [Candidatus Binatia bacterium]